MHFHILSVLLAAASAASAQSVVGTAYGFASGVTGAGKAPAATPSSAAELAAWLSDTTARTIVIDKEFDFTGTKATGSGCDRKSCSASNGGQLYLGDLSCGGSDNVAVSSITYDAAGPTALKVGSNKSIISSNGKGVLKGKGLSLQKGASNVIIQGLTITNINPGLVWGGDGLDFQGGNDGVWVDHCKFSLIGRQFVVSHYSGSRITLSNNEFDGTTTTSASCNGDHYWTMMFIADGDKITLDKNYFHNLSGRAPKLGADGVTGTFQASNNLFSNMKGHAFDAYKGASALLEGNAFESVDTPITDQGASVSTIFNVPNDAAAATCKSALGRACAVNSLQSSGKWPSLSSSSGLSAWSSLKKYLVQPVAASEVSKLVKASAGPSKLGSASSPSKPATTPSAVQSSTPVKTTQPAKPQTSSPSTKPQTPSPSTGTAVAQWGQCGGMNWTGSTKCASGTSCVSQNAYYSQCLGSAARRMKRALRLIN